MAVSTLAPGKTTKWKVKVNLLGQMEDIMLEIMWTTKRKDRESLTGQMVENMTEAGKMVNSMESETIHPPAESQSRENGRRARDCIGCRPLNDSFIIG